MSINIFTQFNILVCIFHEKTFYFPSFCYYLLFIFRRFQLRMCYVKKVTFQERQKTDFHQNCSLDFYQTLTFIFIFWALSIVLTKNMQYLIGNKRAIWHSTIWLLFLLFRKKWIDKIKMCYVDLTYENRRSKFFYQI